MLAVTQRLKSDVYLTFPCDHVPPLQADIHFLHGFPHVIRSSRLLKHTLIGNHVKDNIFIKSWDLEDIDLMIEPILMLALDVWLCDIVRDRPARANRARQVPCCLDRGWSQSRDMKEITRDVVALPSFILIP